MDSEENLGWGRERTLRAAVHEEHAVLHEVLGDIGKFLEGVGHCGGWRQTQCYLREER